MKTLIFVSLILSSNVIYAQCSHFKNGNALESVFDEANKNIESNIRKFMNSIKLNDEVLGYKEGSMNVTRVTTWRSLGNGSHWGNTHSRFKFSSTRGVEFELREFDIAVTRKSDVRDINMFVNLGPSQFDVNARPHGCSISVDVTFPYFQLVNTQTNYGYFIAKESFATPVGATKEFKILQNSTNSQPKNDSDLKQDPSNLNFNFGN